MWKLPDTLARRFPLVARPRPSCLSLPQRIQDLTALANSAAAHGDLSKASTVYNQAALIASDIGDTATARTWCRQHAAVYLDAAPLEAADAIRALEPVVNLVRLQMRTGNTDVGHQQLESLFNAVAAGRSAHLDGVTVPAGLVSTERDRREVTTWLRAVVLADGTRALTSAGRWGEALSHVQRHRGLGRRMLDGRQVAVLAALLDADTAHANHLLTHTEAGDVWEAAVTDCLTVLCLRSSDLGWRRPLHNLVDAYLTLPDREGLTAFRSRLGLVVLDLLSSPEDSVAQQVVTDLCHHAARTGDGYAARDVLSHPLGRELATGGEVKECLRLLSSCALRTGELPAEERAQLTEAVRQGDRTIHARLKQATASETL
ncbi:hypothetical protein [Streptomyces sp. ISL-100]|uniref:hypothetical protein n=1 Tax=Streptomyces sp. ISL-100 TaxID=2819173 RepID=UPI001BE6F5F5|nr:hypothetical protein [Streptomyces sp. ISL-100]MBT2396237.1 hypothetical protein [Streptomyces sp. ISL-100]